MNKNTILTANNISKQYRLGVVGTGTLSHDLNRWWAKVRGKEDPYLKIGAENDRSKAAETDYVWALQDINFEVEEGEVLGIIGKNGAGKSTLLKILSRVTMPTTGSIKTKGRIASLLEVGTGFHPELTGRENIYLNGAILGMTKPEIKAKEEEIIEFSGCAMYVDTPVKRYSSGMRVRLAFAVAAHLEPDILVVDEVLAVGDAEFQKKAVGKMKDISGSGGRTVLFVSHNMASINDLCTRLLVIDNGKVSYIGNVADGINQYLSMNTISDGFINFEDTDKNKKAYIAGIKILNENYNIQSKYKSGEKFNFQVSIKLTEAIRNPTFSLRISDMNNVNVVTWRSNDYINEPIPKNINKDFDITIKCENLYLLDGVYTTSISLLDGKELIDIKKECLDFEVIPSKPSENYHSITKSKSSNSLIYTPAEWIIS